MTAVTTPKTDAYVAAVADALIGAGVPDTERQELLDDLVGHLAELEAEDDESLAAQLGSPDAYATELLTSAGIEVEDAGPPPSEPWWRQVAAAGRSHLQGPRAAALRAFLPELRPGWWVLRGWAIVAMLTAWVPDHHRVFPVPDLLGNGFLSFLALVGAVVASVRLGRRRGWLDKAATGFGVLGVVVAIAVGSPRVEYRSDANDQYPYGGLLTAPNGNVIENIWPFDAEGRPLENVFLFDQYGEPISLGEVGAGGLVIPGLFPQPGTAWEYDEQTGAEREVPATPPDVSIPRLSGSAPTTTSTTLPAETTTTVPPADPGATTTVQVG